MNKINELINYFESKSGCKEEIDIVGVVNHLKEINKEHENLQELWFYNIKKVNALEIENHSLEKQRNEKIELVTSLLDFKSFTNEMVEQNKKIFLELENIKINKEQKRKEKENCNQIIIFDPDQSQINYNKSKEQQQQQQQHQLQQQQKQQQLQNQQLNQQQQHLLPGVFYSFTNFFKKEDQKTNLLPKMFEKEESIIHEMTHQVNMKNQQQQQQKSNNPKPPLKFNGLKIYYLPRTDKYFDLFKSFLNSTKSNSLTKYQFNLLNEKPITTPATTIAPTNINSQTIENKIKTITFFPIYCAGARVHFQSYKQELESLLSITNDIVLWLICGSNSKPIVKTEEYKGDEVSIQVFKKKILDSELNKESFKSISDILNKVNNSM